MIKHEISDGCGITYEIGQSRADREKRHIESRLERMFKMGKVVGTEER